jgi:hypothetical protein
MASEPFPEGWAWPGESRKAHYFEADRRSLCGRWAFFGVEVYDDPEGPAPNSRCADCDRRLASRSSFTPVPSEGEQP